LGPGLDLDFSRAVGDPNEKWAALLAFLIFCTAPAQTFSQANKSANLVLTHVTIIDVSGGPSLHDMTVLVTGDRISRIEPAAKFTAPANSQTIDAAGKFLIPGLWDMHVHPHSPQDASLFIANGITGIRIMWGDRDDFESRKARDAGKLLAPHMYIASPLIDGPKPYWPGSVSVSTEAEARAVVDKAKAMGADFIKVYSFLPREEFLAIADESKKQNISFAGHVPMSVSAQQASNAGMKSIEHLTGVTQACSTLSAELNKASEADLEEHNRTDQHLFEGPRIHAMHEQMFATCNPEKASDLYDDFKRNGTWQVPTLTLWRMFSSINDGAFVNNPQLRFVSIRERQRWDQATVAERSTDVNVAISKSDFQKYLQLVAAMQKASVGILAGTDTGNPYCIPGFALHDELQLLVQAGLTPLQALQAATTHPAQFVANENDFGAVKPGKLANLVLLDANPLDNIANTTKIHAVIIDGQFLDRAALDAMLANVAALANRKPIGDVLFAAIQKDGIRAAVDQYHQLVATQHDSYDFSENELVSLGYRLLHMQKISDAIEIFKLSVEAYPQSYNTYDSLAEAYMDHGDRDLAIQNYRKSLELNPANANGTKMLQKLSAQ
jgi:imidazolonepropionase-like amidohydrolase